MLIVLYFIMFLFSVCYYLLFVEFVVHIRITTSQNLRKF